MQEFVDESVSRLERSRSFGHPFLASLRAGSMSGPGARAFAVQWYKAATAHKRAFPGLIYNTRDDELRVQLIEILHEEYGFGDSQRVHARILEKFLHALDIDPEATVDMPTDPRVQEFSDRVDELWSRGDYVKAFGVHFALEFLAANMHQAFHTAVQTLGLEPDAIEYFQLHSIAEEEHAKLAERGVGHLCGDEDNQRKLMDGMREGAEVVSILLDGLEESYMKAVH